MSKTNPDHWSDMVMQSVLATISSVMSTDAKTWIGQFSVLVAVASAAVGLAMMKQAEKLKSPAVPETSNPTSELARGSENRAHKSIPTASILTPSPDSRDDREISVTLPLGTSVDVTLRDMRQSVPPIQRRHKIHEMYDDLVNHARNGDVASARELAIALSECQMAFATEEEAEQAIVQRQTEGVLTYPTRAGIEPEAFPVGTDTSHYDEVVRNAFDRCEGITDDQILQKDHWLDVAVSGGDITAIQMRTHELGSMSPDSHALYQQLFNDGWLPYGESIGILLRNGVSASPDASPGGASPQYLEAYAYTLAYYAVKLETLRNSARHGVANQIAAMDATLANYASYLTPSEQADAESLAARLLTENDECCIGIWE